MIPISHAILYHEKSNRRPHRSSLLATQVHVVFYLNYSNSQQFETMPGHHPARRRRGRASRTSCTGAESDSRLVAVFVKGANKLGANIDLSKPRNCDILVNLYKKCVIKDNRYCNYYLEKRPESCPEFNKGELMIIFRTMKREAISNATLKYN
ncbi:hypothetical protein RHSIM_Rhsim08G0052900 [Rhododendron simsii]|uniref:Uncharacterized protein n=1 Tax=Rhododendron simsii TaxID=118357 RepID=A0A834GHL5_RHOSS|nr:hypothetical protein RHSIM_Rhsim08G0052900 [Rhododendron simsii]